MKKIEDITAEIRFLIDSGKFPIGHKLPAERNLAEMLGVSRGKVRSALHQLEFYGVIRTMPQSGSYVNDHYFSSLVETRLILETNSAKLCATNRSSKDLERIIEAQESFLAATTPEDRYDRDFNFHQIVAQASGNTILSSLIRNVSAETLVYYHKYLMCDPTDKNVDQEHQELIDAIIAKDPEKAAQIIERHLSKIRSFALTCGF